MIKDKMIELENGTDYYILEETLYNDKKYVLAIECDVLNDEIVDEDCILLEVIVNDDKIEFKGVEDDNLSITLCGILMKKIRGN